MDEKIRQMGCGNCGGFTFTVAANHSEFPTILEIECRDCGSRTIYKPLSPKMVQSWGEGAQGVTCFLNPED